MPQTLEEAAIEYATDLSGKFNHVRRIHFTAGAEWQSKKDEEILNSFFSREAVVEILKKSMGYPGMKIELWFDKNYPPKTIDNVAD